ncbi:hypothetical protein [Bacillus cereus group sp. RP43]|uniref:hypothetical protein n=1 Tax=Bacillus cereus group sp. RP43 TaxID=3040260 RepID=UPI003394E1D7
MEVIYPKWHNNYAELTLGQKYKAILYKKGGACRNGIFATSIVSRRMFYHGFIKRAASKS